MLQLAIVTIWSDCLCVRQLSVCVSVGHVRESCKNSRAVRDRRLEW